MLKFYEDFFNVYLEMDMNVFLDGYEFGLPDYMR